MSSSAPLPFDHPKRIFADRQDIFRLIFSNPASEYTKTETKKKQAKFMEEARWATAKEFYQKGCLAVDDGIFLYEMDRRFWELAMQLYPFKLKWPWRTPTEDPRTGNSLLYEKLRERILRGEGFSASSAADIHQVTRDGGSSAQGRDVVGTHKSCHILTTDSSLAILDAFTKFVAENPHVKRFHVMIADADQISARQEILYSEPTADAQRVGDQGPGPSKHV